MTEIVLGGTIHVPSWVQDLESFRRWTVSDEYPDQGEISFLDGTLWVDPSLERDVHNQIKTAITATLGGLVKCGRLGRFYGDSMRLVHPQTGLSTEPDALFAAQESLVRQCIQLRQGKDSLELVGSPDMVLEVVSPTSVVKDTVHLLDLYRRSGVREYWLVNPLGGDLDFHIYRGGARKFAAVRPQRGWLRSEVFARSVRLTEAVNELDLPEFTLAVR
jgi:Uma2 family endonuclease